MNKPILFLIALFLTTGCALTKQQRTDNRVAKKLEKLQKKHPESFENATTEIVRIDTVIKEVEIEGELRIDTLEVENLVKEYVTDTVEIPRFITRFLNSTRDTVDIDTLGVAVFIAGSNVDYRIKRDSIHIEKEQAVKTITVTKTEVVRVVWWKDPWFWVLVALILLFILQKLGKLAIFK